MSSQDHDDTINTASGANESSITALKNRVQNAESEVQNIESQSQKCNNLLSDGLQQLKRQSAQESNGIKEKFKRNQEIRFPLTDEIALRFAERYLTSYKNLTFDQICEIGYSLMRNYGSLRIAGQELGIPHFLLRDIIAKNPDLLYFYNIAIQGVKMLTDENIIELLQAKDKDITKLMARLLYKGRKMGAYNPSEFGTTGFGDEVGEYNASVTKEDEKDGDNFTINFNFETKPLPPPVVEGELIEEAKKLDISDIMAIDIEEEE